MNVLTTTLLPPSRWLYKPMTWIVPAILLAVVDLLSPASLHACVLATFFVPLAWNNLPRRYMPLLMASLLVAVTVPGLFHAVGIHPLYAEIDRPIPDSETLPFEMTRILAEPFIRFGADRIWTLVALCGLWWFHNRLQDRRRRRLRLRRVLQARVLHRTNQVKRANKALRSEVIRRQETQHLLDQSESTFEALIQRMELQVTRKDTQGVITFANDIYCQKLGLDKSQVIGSTDEDLFDPEIAQKYRLDDLRIMKTGQIVDQIEQHPTVDGKTGFAQVFKAPEYDRDGNCIGIQIIFWDVTRKHLGEITLRDSEARKRALFDSAGDAVVLIGDDNVVVEANPAATVLFGDTLLGKDFDSVATPVFGYRFTGDSAPHRWELLPRATRQDLTIRRRDRTEFESEVSVHTIPVGDAEGCAVIVRDVTLQKRAFEALRNAKAAAEAANRTKTEFMAGVSHELRTPLGGSAGLTDLLSKTELTPPAQEYVRMIGRSTQALTDVIEDILDFAAIEAGRVDIDPRPIDLHVCLGDAFKSLAVRAAEKPLQLILSIDPETPRYAIVDPKRFRQIIINLVGNAIKFTPLGEVRVRLSLDHEFDGPEFIGPEDEPTFLIEVADTGVGIPNDKQAEVFTAFERGEIGTKRSFGGTGLGLSISDGLVRRMGGRIDLVSQPDVGSCFSCRLPLKRASAADASSRPPRRPDAKKTARLVGRILTGVPNMDAAFEETLASLGIAITDEPMTLKRDGKIPTLWVLRSDGPTTWRDRVHHQNDRVVWIQKVGGTSAPIVAARESRLNEPVTPDELTVAVHDLLSDRDQRAPNRRNGDPRIWASGDAPAATLAPPIDHKGDLLLVDDSEVNRLVIRRQLEALGYKIETAVDGQKAVQTATRRHFDCILMDLQMPIMDGTEATAEIREAYRRKAAAPPPIIALTAHVTAEHELMCKQAGMSGFITKPVRVKALTNAIESALHPDSDRWIRGDRADTQRDDPVADPAGTPPEQSLAPEHNDMTDDSNADTSPATTPVPRDRDAEATRQQLLRYSGGSADIAVSLCDAFLEEVPDLLRRVRNHRRSNQNGELMRAAHTLKSCLRYVANPAAIGLAADLEKNAKEKKTISAVDIETLGSVCEAWQEHVRHVRETFRG